MQRAAWLFSAATLPLLACTPGTSPAAQDPSTGDGDTAATGTGLADPGADAGDGSSGADAATTTVATSDTGEDIDPPPPTAGAFPLGLAVASPTAALGMAVPAGAAAAARSPEALAASPEPHAAATLMPGKPYATKQAELAALLAGVDCDLVLGQFGGGFNPMCYGPWLDYQNHPDAPMGMPADGQLPSGDLGLWMASEPGGQACAAVKLNALVDDVALKVDYGLYLAAQMQCTMVTDGITAPDVGAEVDRTAATDASLAATNPGLTVTHAVIARDADADGRSVYRYELQLSYDQGGMTPLEMSTTVVHRADLVDAGDYRGRIWSRFDNLAPMNDTYAYSLDYAQDVESLRYDVVGAAFSDGAADPHDDEGAFDYTAAWSGNATRAAVELDPASGSSNLLFAWQAGHGDGNTRVFNVGVEFDAPDHGVGCGFFGFGAPFTDAGPPDGDITTFICNWAGPGNQHAGEVGWAQKQCMETMGGVFVATESRIGYAPVNDCDTTADPAFAYRDPTQMDFHTEPLARDLVELATDPDHMAWSHPAAP